MWAAFARAPRSWPSCWCCWQRAGSARPASRASRARWAGMRRGWRSRRAASWRTACRCCRTASSTRVACCRRTWRRRPSPWPGVGDQAARLQSLVFGSLLVLAVYRLGRLAGGAGPALAAAAIVAFSQPLVLQAREAWLYSSFLFWLVLAVGWLVRDRPGDRVRAGLLLGRPALARACGAADPDCGVARPRALVGRRRRHGSRLAPAAARRAGLLGHALAGVAVVGMLALALRAPTAGGTTGRVSGVPAARPGPGPPAS